MTEEYEPGVPSLEEYIEEQLEELRRYEEAYIERSKVSLAADDIHGYAVYANRASQCRQQRQLLIRILAGEA